MLGIIKNSTILSESEELTMNGFEVYVSSKFPVTKGKWYYEFTHISGSQMHLIGFISDNWAAQFYAANNIKSPQYYRNDFIAKTTEHDILPFSVAEVHTVGLGIDIEAKKMYVVYGENVQEYGVSMMKEGDKIKAVMREAHSSDAKDVLRINFGSSAFKYKLHGFKPWSGSVLRVTSFCKKQTGIRYAVICILLNSQ